MEVAIIATDQAMETYVVKQGDCLNRIAHRFDFRDYRIIYDHPKNADFRRKRPNPDLIFPGDTLYIPDKSIKEAVCSTGGRHTFRVKGLFRWIRIAVEDEDCKRIANKPYELTVEGRQYSGSTTAQGLLEQKIPADAERGTLKIGAQLWELSIAHLNPLAEDTPDGGVSGAQGRLHNLGYPVGPIDGVLGPKTKAAIRYFQADEGLPCSGELNAATREKLVGAYGF